MVGFQCGSALVGCGAVVVLVVFSLPDLWLISSAEYGCSGQCGRRSGCMLLGMDAAGVGLLLVLPCWTRCNVN